jgi:hypothetical protein
VSAAGIAVARLDRGYSVFRSMSIPRAVILKASGSPLLVVCSSSISSARSSARPQQPSYGRVVVGCADVHLGCFLHEEDSWEVGYSPKRLEDRFSEVRGGL